MNCFAKELENYFGHANYKKILNCRIGIAGAGGLGSNCACFLVRSGFRKFRIYDFDKVSYSNLNRQFYFYRQVGSYKVDALKKNLLDINPALELDMRKELLTHKNTDSAFSGCDIIIEAFDKAEAKSMLAEAYMNSGKLYVSASGLAGWGNSDEIQIRKMHDNFYLVGDMVSEASASKPPFAPRVNIASAKEADIALTWVLENGKIL